MPPSHPNCTWVKRFDPPCKKAKARVRLGPTLRCSNLLAVECLYGDSRLCKLEVQSIFSILDPCQKRVYNPVEDL